jgi:TRAP-type C4-dicarboxylate transport system substrate-binding protein
VEQRVIILEEAKKAEEQYAVMAAEKLIPSALSEMKEGGMKVNDWPKEDVAQWGEMATSVYKMASDKMTAKKLPGEQMVKRYLELTKTSSSELRKLYEKAWANRINWAKNL